jgi:hypothetical protein
MRRRKSPMLKIEARLERIENELRFWLWVMTKRMSESMSLQEIEELRATGQWPERPAPPPGASRLDGMDRKDLEKLWKADIEWEKGKSKSQTAFYCRHGHWPEQACGAGCRLTGSTETPAPLK